jgi:hypothetical protein
VLLGDGQGTLLLYNKKMLEEAAEKEQAKLWVVTVWDANRNPCHAEYPKPKG